MIHCGKAGLWIIAVFRVPNKEWHYCYSPKIRLAFARTCAAPEEDIFPLASAWLTRLFAFAA